MGYLVIVVIVLAVFLLCREVMCWYWKINLHLKNQEEIRDLLKQLLSDRMAQEASLKEQDPPIAYKYSVGDWVTLPNGKIAEIGSVKNGKYLCITNGDYYQEEFEEKDLSR